MIFQSLLPGEGVISVELLAISFFNEFISSDYLENSQDVTPEHLFLNRQIHTNTNKTILITENKLKMPDEHKPLNNFFIIYI